MELHGWFEIVDEVLLNSVKIRSRYNEYIVFIGDDIDISQYKKYTPSLMYILFEQNPFSGDFKATLISIVGDKI